MAASLVTGWRGLGLSEFRSHEGEKEEEEEEEEEEDEEEEVDEWEEGAGEGTEMVTGMDVFKSQEGDFRSIIFVFFFFSSWGASPSLPPTLALQTLSLSSTGFSDNPGTLDQP